MCENVRRCPPISIVCLFYDICYSRVHIWMRPSFVTDKIELYPQCVLFCNCSSSPGLPAFLIDSVVRSEQHESFSALLYYSQFAWKHIDFPYTIPALPISILIKCTAFQFSLSGMRRFLFFDTGNRGNIKSMTHTSSLDQQAHGGSDENFCLVFTSHARKMCEYIQCLALRFHVFTNPNFYVQQFFSHKNILKIRTMSHLHRFSSPGTSFFFTTPLYVCICKYL